MTRVAIYARYSSDNQREASIEDQVRICTERATREGWQIVGTYTDAAVSGASMMRPGIQSLLKDALNGKFDLVLSEALDRISRDQEDIAGVYKRMQFANVKIFCLRACPRIELSDRVDDDFKRVSEARMEASCGTRPPGDSIVATRPDMKPI